MRMCGNLADLGMNSSKHCSDHIQSLRVMDVEPDPNQEQEEFRDIKLLTKSIQQSGLLQPIVVTEKNHNGKHKIINGERRWRALVSLKMDKIKAIVRFAAVASEREALEIIDTIQRDNLTPKEICAALKTMRAFGFDNSTIANKLGKSEAYVYRHLKLTKDLVLVDKLIDRGVVNVDILDELIKLHALSTASIDNLFRLAEGKKLSRGSVRNALKAEKYKRDKQFLRAEKKKQLLIDIVPDLPQRHGLDGEYKSNG